MARSIVLVFVLAFLCPVLGKSFAVRLSDHGGSGLAHAVKCTCSYVLCVTGNLAPRWPLASPEMVSSRPDLSILSHLRFRDPDHFRAGMIHGSLPMWEHLLADCCCSTVDLLEIVREGVRLERFFYPV